MAELIFVGGDIVTMDDDVPWVEAIAIKDGRIIACGSRAEVMKLKTEDCVVEDLAGRTLMPGLVDTHTHPGMSAFFENGWIDLGCDIHSSIKEVGETLRKAAGDVAPGEWISGYAFNQLNMSDVLEVPMDRHFLDSVSTKHPIVVMAIHTHGLYVNSVALEMAGLDSSSAVQGTHGYYEKDENGQLTGVCVDIDACLPFFAVMPPFGEEEAVKCLGIVFEDFLKQGVTSIGDCDGGIALHCPCPGEVIKRALNNRTVRLRAYPMHHQYNVPGQVLQSSNPTEQSNQPFKVVGVKAFVDGSVFQGTIAPRNALENTEVSRKILRLPHPTMGSLMMTADVLVATLRQRHAEGCQIALHVQGEVAIDAALDCLAALLEWKPREDHRHRLEHCGLITESQVARAADLGVALSFMNVQIRCWGRGLRDHIMGKQKMYRWAAASFAAARGLRYSVHSDTPCAKPFILHNVQTLVTRRFDLRHEVFGEKYRCDRWSALKAVTINAAWQLNLDSITGSICVGKYADLVVLGQNPLKVKEIEIGDIAILKTYREGVCVFQGADA